VIDLVIKEPERRNKIISASLSLRLIFALIAFTASTAYIYLNTNDLKQVLLISILNISYFFSISESFNDLLTADLKSKAAAITRTVSYIISAAIKIYLINTQASIDAFLIVFSLEVLIQAIGYSLSFVRKDKKFKLETVETSLMATLAGKAVPLFLSVVSYFVASKFYVVLMERYTTFAEVGYFSTANKFSEIWLLVLGVVIANVTPKITNVYKVDNGKYQELKGNLYTFLTGSSLLYSIFIFVFAAAAVNLLLGPQYAVVTTLLHVLAWEYVFMAPAVGLNRFMVLEGLRSEFISIALLQIITSVSIGFLLISQYGIYGVTWAVVISRAVNILVVPMLFSRTREHVVTILSSLFPPRIFQLMKWFTQ
jgi:PST family polysaccharide transporter